MTSSTRLTIGISACLMHPDPERKAFAKKTLHYVEQSMAEWLAAGDALPVMIPALNKAALLADYAQWLDGLVLHGGVDVWPGSYGEEPLRAHWSGDKLRDQHEQALVKAFMAAGKPVFGICRGLQLINVAYGGTLLQDIETQRPDARTHRDAERYDTLLHGVDVVPGTRLAQLLPNAQGAKINSIHHQGIKTLAPNFVIEARCPEDQMIEAIRYTGPGYLAAVQWHPEFHRAALGTLDDSPLRADFLAAAASVKHKQVTKL